MLTSTDAGHRDGVRAGLPLLLGVIRVVSIDRGLQYTASLGWRLRRRPEDLPSPITGGAALRRLNLLHLRVVTQARTLPLYDHPSAIALRTHVETPLIFTHTAPLIRYSRLTATATVTIQMVPASDCHSEPPRRRRGGFGM